MADVILFYPKLETVKPRLLPASVLSLAGPLMAAGYSVKIIDQRVSENWRKALLSALKEKPLLVGFSAMTGIQIKNALEATRFVKENSGVPVVWGGVHPTLLPEQTLENPFIDFVVLGEGEVVMVKLADALKNKKPVGGISGLGYKENGKIIVSPQKEFVNLNQLPDLPYGLINIKDYIRDGALDMHTSRGCPHHCSFCYNQEFNKRRWRGESPERVVSKMKELVLAHGLKAIDIEDDEFFVDMDRVKKICQLLIKENLRIEIFTNCRINYVAERMDKDLLKLCLAAGFKVLGFGVESGSPRIQQLMCKEITNSQVFETIRKLKESSVGSKYYFMSGLPTETIEDLHATTDLIVGMKKADRNIRIPSWRVFVPYPGTELYGISRDHGFVPPKNLEEWASYDFKTIRMPWVKGRARRTIKNVIYSIDFIELENTSSKRLYFKLSRLYGKTVDFRWRKHWFYFPEKFLVNFIKEIKHGR